MIYIVILAVLAIFSVVEYAIFDNYKNKFINQSTVSFKFIRYGVFWTLIAFLIVFAGLRFFTGLDFASYRWIFNMSRVHVRAADVEYGYYGLNEFINNFTHDPQWIYLIMALLTLPLKGIFINKKSSRIYLSLFIYFTMFFLVYDMGQMRSSLAQAIGLIAILFYMNNKKKIAFVLILFGMLFHSSEVILLLIFIIGDRKYSFKTIVLTYIGAVIFGQLLNLHYIGSVASKFPNSHLAMQINHYTTNPVFASKIGLSLNVIFDFFLLALILFIRWYKNLEDKKFNIMFNIYFIGICLYLVFNNYSVLGIRLGDYFRLILIVLIPFVINQIKNKKIKYLILFIFIGIFSTIVFRELTVNAHIYLPYKLNFFGNVFTL